MSSHHTPPPNKAPVIASGMPSWAPLGLLLVAWAAWLVADPAFAVDGRVVAWGGYNPLPAVNGTDGTASAIEAGGYCGYWNGSSRISTGCAIQAGTGAVVCWGYNYYGVPTPPRSVDGTTGTASAISATDIYSCAIQAGSGAVVCWGQNDYGRATPPPSVNGSAGTASAIAAGARHSCAI